MFSCYVSLYRALGKPAISAGGKLTVFRKNTMPLRTEIRKFNQQNEEVEISFDEGDEEIYIDVKFPRNDSGAFYQSVEDFIESTPSLKNGVLRENFYIIDLDYCSGESEPEVIGRIKNAVDFLKALRCFVGLSIEEEISQSGGSLIFLKPSDGKSPQKAAILKPKFTLALIEVDIPSFKILQTIKDGFLSERPQIEERILLLNSSIAHVLDECENESDALEYLVSNWKRVKQKYLHDLHAYVGSFTFDETRRKISEGLIDSTTKINAAIADVGTKLFAVPVSLAALALLKDQTGISLAFGILGVLVSCLIIFITIIHYSKQIDNLYKSFEFNMRQTSKSKKTFSAEIRGELHRIDCYKEKLYKNIKATVMLYKCLALVPVFLLAGWGVWVFLDFICSESFRL